MYLLTRNMFLVSGCVLIAGCTDTRNSESARSPATVELPAPATVELSASARSAPRRVVSLSLSFDTSTWTDSAEADAIAASAGRVRREGPLLEVRLPGGKSVRLRNTTGTVDASRYVYLGELAPLGSHVIGVLPEEIPPLHMLLLDERSGDTTAVTGVPVISPDHKRFLVVPHEVSATNDVEIWSVASGVPRFEWGTGDEERPIDGAWKDDSTVTYRVVSAAGGLKTDTSLTELPFRGGGWQIATRVAP